MRFVEDGGGGAGPCIPSRCERENCVRCACTAATKLTEGRQRAAARCEDPTAAPPLSCGPPLVTLSREHYGLNRRSTDLQYNNATTRCRYTSDWRARAHVCIRPTDCTIPVQVFNSCQPNKVHCIYTISRMLRFIY